MPHRAAAAPTQGVLVRLLAAFCIFAQIAIVAILIYVQVTS